MGALVAMAVGLLAGAWSAALGLRLPGAWIGCALVLAAGALWVTGTRGAPVRPSRLGCALLGLLTALVGQALAPRPVAGASSASGTARLSGVVVTSRARGGLLRVTSGAVLDGTERLPRGALVSLRGLDVAPGASVRLLARVRPAARFDNPSPHPDWPAGRRPTLYGAVRGQVVVERPAAWPSRLAHGIRGGLRARLERSLSPRTAAIGRTLLLGESRSLEDDTRDIVRGAGLSHVLAVSGLHVTLLAGGAVWLLGLAWRRIPWLARRVPSRRAARWLGIPLALSYAGLVGDAPSAWRAAVTAAIAWALEAGGRRASPGAVTAAAVITLASLRPEDLPRPGFALSILATAAIVTGGSREGEGALRAGLALAARSTVATAPITAWIFGAVPAVGLIANVVVVPFAAAALLPALVLHALTAWACEPLAFATAALAERATDAFVALAAIFETVPLGRDLPPLDLPQGIAVALTCGGLLLARSWRARVAILLSGLALIAGLELRLRWAERPLGELRVTFLDVGQGDAALVDLPDGRLMVIDAGGAPGGGPDPGERALVPLLRARRRSRIDVLVISHPHPDHYEGARALIERFEVGEVWDSGQALFEAPGGPVARLLVDAHRRGARVLGPEQLCRATRRFGRAVLRVHHPCPRFDAGWGPNENSLVLELRLGDRRLLFAGDAEAHAEAALLARGVEPVDVLKVAHHGSRTSSSAALLDALRPRVAVVSAGRHNRFGHPHAEVWARLRRRASCARRTDRHGGVVLRTDGRRLEVDGCAEPRRLARPGLSR